MIRPLADVRHQYRPEFGVDRHQRRFAYGGYLLTLKERAGWRDGDRRAGGGTMKLTLTASTRTVLLVVGLLTAAVAAYLALGFQAWGAVLEFGGLAVACLAIAYFGVDAENPRGAHRSFHLTRKGDEPDDERGRSTGRARDRSMQ